MPGYGSPQCGHPVGYENEADPWVDHDYNINVNKGEKLDLAQEIRSTRQVTKGGAYLHYVNYNFIDSRDYETTELVLKTYGEESIGKGLTNLQIVDNLNQLKNRFAAFRRIDTYSLDFEWQCIAPIMKLCNNCNHMEIDTCPELLDVIRKLIKKRIPGEFSPCDCNDEKYSILVDGIISTVNASLPNLEGGTVEKVEIPLNFIIGAVDESYERQVTVKLLLSGFETDFTIWLEGVPLGSVQGNVIHMREDYEGEYTPVGLVGIDVTIEGRDNNISRNAKTRGGGGFLFPELIPGVYYLSVQRFNAGATVNVYGGETTTHRFIVDPGY